MTKNKVNSKNTAQKVFSIMGGMYSLVIIAGLLSALFSVLYLFLAWLYTIVSNSIQNVLKAPDVNGDGSVTISDMPQAASNVLLAVGKDYQALLSKHEYGQFLEMSAENPSTFWSVIFSCGVYLALYGGVMLVYKAVVKVAAYIKTKFLAFCSDNN